MEVPESWRIWTVVIVTHNLVCYEKEGLLTTSRKVFLSRRKEVQAYVPFDVFKE